MLVYVNSFKIVGANRHEALLNSINGWLSKITKQSVSVTEKPNQDFGQIKVQYFAAEGAAPYLYAILVRHPDREVRGRWWETEISYQTQENHIDFSISIETKDISARVTALPTAHRPQIIEYLRKNCDFSSETAGLDVKTLDNGDENFAALLHEIERRDRFYPLVLVSDAMATEEQEEARPLTDPNKLQSNLFGLAQVIYIPETVDSWELERILTRRYAAWDGSINIIFPMARQGKIARKLWLKDDLKAASKIWDEIVTDVTDNSNGYHIKNHSRPVDVRAKRQRDRLEVLRAQQQQNDHLDQAHNDWQELAEEAFKSLDEEKERFTVQLQKRDDDLLEQEMAIEALQKKNEEIQEALEAYKKEEAKTGGKNNISLSFKSEEPEHYENEFRNIVLFALNKVVEKYDALDGESDKATGAKRRKVIIEHLASHNDYIGVQENLDQISRLIGDYSKTKNKIRLPIESLGLKVVNDGNNHNSIQFQRDDRFKVTFARSTSDKSRMGKNVVRDLRKTFFY